MVYITKDPILTYFNSLSTAFRGFGINLNLVDGGPVSVKFDALLAQQGLSFTYGRTLIGTQDPTLASLNSTTLADMDNIYKTTPFANDGTVSTDANGNTTTGPSTAQTFFSSLSNAKMEGIYSFVPPQSWLDVNGYLTGESAISGYANYIVSGILWVRSFGMAANMVELFPHPSSDATGLSPRIYPDDLVTLANRVRDISALRISADAPSILILGPGLSSVMSTQDISEPYIEAFFYGKYSLDTWSIRGNENEKDATIYNSGTFAARTLLREQLARNLALMNAVKFEADHMVTSFSTRSTAWVKSDYNIANDPPDVNTGLIQPTVVNQTVEYALRNADNICNMLNNGMSVVLFSELSDLMDSTGSVLPTGKLFSMLMSTPVPIPGTMYLSEEINPAEDATVKTMLLSNTGDRFAFFLCRPVQPDPLLGRLRLTVNNPLWNTEYSVTNVEVTSYPDPALVTTTTTVDALGNVIVNKQVGAGVDLSNVVTQAVMNWGSMSLFVQGLPYGGCCILITGNVVMAPPVPPVPAPTPSPAPAPSGGGGGIPPGSNPVVIQTIMQIPVNFGEPALTTYAVGTVFYDSEAKTLKTWNGSNWIPAPMMTYV